MANRNYASHGKIYAMHVEPILIDCNFIVDSTNGNMLGQRSLKGPTVHQVLMQYATAGGPYTPPAGSPNLGSTVPFALISHSSITNTGPSVLTGNMALSPGTSVTGFPPGSVIGVQHITDAVASQAETDANTAYNQMVAMGPGTAISSTLDGQTLSAGVYSESSGTFNLAQSGNGTLTLNGSATDVWVFIASSTLVTGAGGTPTIALTGGALASNVYWAVGSSATLNVSGTGNFVGTVIAHASITGDGGSASGRMFALTGSVTLDDMDISVPATPPVLPTYISGPGPGVIVVQLEDNFNRSISGIRAVVAPASGIPLKIDNSALTQGQAYIIVALDPSVPNSQWNALGLPAGVAPAIGASFIAASVGAGSNTSSARVELAVTSNIASIETVGDPNQSIAPNLAAAQGFGAQFILQCRNSSGAVAAPVDGTVISLGFLLNNSGVTLQGE